MDRLKIIERSEGALFGNDSVRFGDQNFAVQFKTDDGKVYAFAVEQSYQKKLEALNLAIGKGTRIRLSEDDFNSYLKGTIGSIWDHQLEVLVQDKPHTKSQ